METCCLECTSYMHTILKLNYSHWHFYASTPRAYLNTVFPDPHAEFAGHETADVWNLSVLYNELKDTQTATVTLCREGVNFNLSCNLITSS